MNRKLKECLVISVILMIVVLVNVILRYVILLPSRETNRALERGTEGQRDKETYRETEKWRNR